MICEIFHKKPSPTSVSFIKIQNLIPNNKCWNWHTRVFLTRTNFSRNFIVHFSKGHSGLKTYKNSFLHFRFHDFSAHKRRLMATLRSLVISRIKEIDFGDGTWKAELRNNTRWRSYNLFFFTNILASGALFYNIGKTSIHLRLKPNYHKKYFTYKQLQFKLQLQDCVKPTQAGPVNFFLLKI